MNYKEYLNIVRREFKNIFPENILFWNLWNITYPFETLEKYKDEYQEEFNIFNNMWNFCWEAIEKNNLDIAKFKFIFEKHYPFDFNDDGEIINCRSIFQERYDNYRDDILQELCITLLIGSFNSIYEGIINNKKIYGEHVDQNPIEIISLILYSNGLELFDNMHLPIVKNEIESQIKLIKLLSIPQNFTFKDKNIFRDFKSMNSISYNKIIVEEE